MNVKTELLLVALVILGAPFIYGYRLLRDLDVMSLGRENVINLELTMIKLY